MRIVIIGASKLAVVTAHQLIDQGHQVTIIEANKARIDELSQHLDCGFLLGDGSQPDLLREADPAHTGLLYCLTNHDQTNIIAGLAARNLGYPRVVCLIDEVDYEPLCRELGLEEIITPLRSVSQRLVGLTERPDAVAPEETIKFDAALYVRSIATAVSARELPLPENARLIGFYRDAHLEFADPDSTLAPGDELLIVARRSVLEKLDKLFDGLAGPAAEPN